jgi:hypothetical protein
MGDPDLGRRPVRVLNVATGVPRSGDVSGRETQGSGPFARGAKELT